MNDLMLSGHFADTMDSLSIVSSVYFSFFREAHLPPCSPKSRPHIVVFIPHVTRLALCQYTLPQCVCIVVRIISTKNRFTKARHNLPHPACTFVCDTSGSKLRWQRHWGNESTHVNILLSSATTMGSTSCKSSQDVSKMSREQIQPITISTPSKIKKAVCILRLGPPSAKAK